MDVWFRAPQSRDAVHAPDLHAPLPHSPTPPLAVRGAGPVPGQRRLPYTISPTDTPCMSANAWFSPPIAQQKL
jgi:hypothetical protein